MKPAAWLNRKSSTPSKKICPMKRTRASGTGARWPLPANTRWGLNLRDRDLKKIGRENLSEELIKLAHEAISRIDLSSCARYLDPDYGVRAACAWLHDKFGVEIAPEEARELGTGPIRRASPPAGNRLVRPPRIRIPGARRSVPLLGPRRERSAARFGARRPCRMGQASVRCRHQRRRPQEQAARRNPNAAR